VSVPSDSQIVAEYGADHRLTINKSAVDMATAEATLRDLFSALASSASGSSRKVCDARRGPAASCPASSTPG
jgi:hypothetical protein